MKKGIDFLKEVQAEFNKVTWPTRKETISSTYLVLVMVIIIAGFLGLVDYLLSWIVKGILN